MKGIVFVYERCNRGKTSPIPHQRVVTQWRRNNQLRSKVRTWALKYKRKAKNCIKKRGNPLKILRFPLQEARKTQENNAFQVYAK